jgi:ribosomal protein S18 acetylase RimI-like enzyme
MSNANTTSNQALERIRPLAAGDVARVVAIDREITGRRRDGFYERRMAAMQKHADELIGLGHADGGGLNGFVLASILDGEFDGRFPVAMLDAIGVAPDARGCGIGRALLTALEAELRARYVRELRTEAPWNSAGLLRLFAGAGFALAPRVLLERSTQERVSV